MQVSAYSLSAILMSVSAVCVPSALQHFWMRRIFLESGSVVCPVGRSPLLLLLAAAVECDTVALAPVAVDTVKFLMCKFCTANQQFFLFIKWNATHQILRRWIQEGRDLHCFHDFKTVRHTTCDSFLYLTDNVAKLHVLLM